MPLQYAPTAYWAVLFAHNDGSAISAVLPRSLGLLVVAVSCGACAMRVSNCRLLAYLIAQAQRPTDRESAVGRLAVRCVACPCRLPILGQLS